MGNSMGSLARSTTGTQAGPKGAPGDKGEPGRPGDRGEKVSQRPGHMCVRTFYVCVCVHYKLCQSVCVWRTLLCQIITSALLITQLISSQSAEVGEAKRLHSRRTKQGSTY